MLRKNHDNIVRINMYFAQGLILRNMKNRGNIVGLTWILRSFSKQHVFFLLMETHVCQIITSLGIMQV